MAKDEELKTKVFDLTIKPNNERKKLSTRIYALNKKYDDEIKNFAT